MEVDVILFDWGGTLSQVVRQDELLRRGAQAAARVLCESGIEEAIPCLIGKVEAMEKAAASHPELREADFSDVLQAWAREFDGLVHIDRIPAAIEAIGREWIGSLEPFPGSVEAVKTLHRHGIKLGLVSNCMLPPVYCRQEFERHGFGGLFNFTLFSSEIGYRKPSPKIYEEALRRAFPQDRPADLSRVMFVGDSPAFDVAAPAALGMKTALVTCYKGIWSAEDYARAKPDLRIDAVAELPARLGMA
ncbi:MAG TPA: HAD family hydrolase [Phycisphaerae bacterium]|nr:HAD family hydrolase [Phycisphaerae bacterium]HOB73634.1 HAD family hydrolase [Phycisphaerae bacterium]HOJ54761.1 HAD family hydrolase [Phycisphaerae bacterium]HOL25887.1 HAD family hydrolase [Phycisphaerae bacterium]HPP21181.1 HAD family hydrolase [Phycisphaerae bacterium]